MYFLSLLLKLSLAFPTGATEQDTNITSKNTEREPRIGVENEINKVVNNSKNEDMRHGNVHYEVIVEGDHGDKMYKISYDDDKTGDEDFNDEDENDYRKYLVNLSDSGDQYVINIENLPGPKNLVGNDNRATLKNKISNKREQKKKEKMRDYSWKNINNLETNKTRDLSKNSAVRNERKNLPKVFVKKMDHKEKSKSKLVDSSSKKINDLEKNKRDKLTDKKQKSVPKILPARLPRRSLLLEEQLIPLTYREIIGHGQKKRTKKYVKSKMSKKNKKKVTKKIPKFKERVHRTNDKGHLILVNRV